MSTEEPWREFLREFFGDQADAALEQMQQMGFDPAMFELNQANLPAGAMAGVVQHLQGLMSGNNGNPVNWQLSREVARGLVAHHDPVVTAKAASDYRSYVAMAELLLDPVTDFLPAPGPALVLSRSDWVERTLPTWQAVTGPVLERVSAGLKNLLKDAGQELGTPDILQGVGALACGMQAGQALGALAQESFGASDLGLPLLDPPVVALVPVAIEEFAGDLDIPLEEVQIFLALREAAHARLFNAVGWLPGQLTTAIARYANGIQLDLSALDEVVLEGNADPQQLQIALSNGIFVPPHTDEQKHALANIETLLALIEGWVDQVVWEAGLPALSEAVKLQEMMRRRRAAGGPAEATFSNLLGLEMRPRRLRDASELWAALKAQTHHHQDRDKWWKHPDLLPNSDDLQDWQRWVNTTEVTVSDNLDDELRKLLSEESE